MSGNKGEKYQKSADEIRLGSFVFSLQTNEIKDKNGNPIHLRRQSTDVLACLAQHDGELVTKDEIAEVVWADTHVTDDSLTKCIADIRQALHDTRHRIVQTVPKRGYRLESASVSEQASADVTRSHAGNWTDRRMGLGWLLTLVVFAIVSVGGVLWWQQRATEFEPVDPGSMHHLLPDRPSIAVLAFDDYSVGSDRDYLSDAIAEGVITGLSRFEELFVIARSSSFQFRAAPTDVRKIAQTLGVRYVIEGSQQKSDDQLRITVQLIDALEGHHLWSDTYDRKLSDAFLVQDEVVHRVVATVAAKLIEMEGEQAQTSSTSKLTALRHNLRSRPFLHEFSPEGTEKARLANLEAIKADPQQPYGYMGMAYVYINGFRWGWGVYGREESLVQARVMAQKALDLGPEYHGSHTVMAYVETQTGELDRAITRLERALVLNPNSTVAMGKLVEILGYAGRSVEAEELQLKAMRLDPLHHDWMKWNLAWLQWMNGKCDQALDTMHAMSTVTPLANRVLALIHVCLGQQSEAEAAIATLLEHLPGYSIPHVRKNFRGKYRNEADLERYIDGLKQAGLPG